MRITRSVGLALAVLHLDVEVAILGEDTGIDELRTLAGPSRGGDFRRPGPRTGARVTDPGDCVRQNRDANRG